MLLVQWVQVHQFVLQLVAAVFFVIAIRSAFCVYIGTNCDIIDY